MDATTNPFAVLTLIAAPAVLTNACCVLALGTSNRLARAVDRERDMATQLEQWCVSEPERATIISEELSAAQTRTLMLLRALQAFYVAIGSFAMAAMLSLVGAVLHFGAPLAVSFAMELVAVAVGTAAVGAIVRGAWLLVNETKIAVAMMKKRTERVQREFEQKRKIRPDQMPS